jgi:hypothetical protein
MYANLWRRKFRQVYHISDRVAAESEFRKVSHSRFQNTLAKSIILHQVQMFSGIVFACLAFGAIASPTPQVPAAATQPIPATGENGKPNGIFGFGDLKPEDMLKGGANANKGGTGKSCSSLVNPFLPQVVN